jgi:uncharacterized protein YceK
MAAVADLYLALACMFTSKHFALVGSGCVCILLFALSGCAAIGARERDGAGRSFAGVRDDWHYLAHPSEADMPALQPLNILDMPFSFVADFFCWPYDLAVSE